MSQIIISNGNLKPILRQLKSIVPGRPVISALKNVLFRVQGDGSASLTCMDMEDTIICETTVQNTSEEAFSALVPFEFISRISDVYADIPLTLSFENNGLKVQASARDRYELKSLDPLVDYPKIPEFLADGQSIKVDSEFISWLNRAALTMSKDTLRPSMSRVCIDIQTDHLALVSTNGQLLFIKKFDIQSNAPDELLVGGKCIKALSLHQETEILWSKNHIAFKSDKTTVITTRLSDRYVNYSAVIPRYEANVDFETSAFQLALKKVSIAAPSYNGGEARLSLKEQIGIVSINAIEDDIHSSKIDLPADYTGDVEHVNFSVTNMQTMLSQITFEEISLAIHHPTRAMLITSKEDPSYLGLIMPLMVN